MNATESTAVAAGRSNPAREFIAWLSRRAKAPLHALARHAARSYIAGNRIQDALAVAGRLAQRRIASTLGFWDGPSDPPETVFTAYQSGVSALAGAKLDSYLSLKLPSLGYSRELLSRLVSQAADLQVRLHFDALAPETVDPTWQCLESCRSDLVRFGCTLPARWRRSPADADWAAEMGFGVRVVKGQWPDPDEPKLDPRRGYLDVIRRLAGRARHVAVASHDLATARRSLEILLEANTPTSLELLYGLPSRRQVELASTLGVPVRVYVPYGSAYLPYCLAQMKRNPRIAWWLLRDAVRQ
jgi:proline dehydrogenase